MNSSFKIGDKVRFLDDSPFGDVWTIESESFVLDKENPCYNLIRNENNYGEGFAKDLKLVKIIDIHNYYIQKIKSCQYCKHFICNKSFSICEIMKKDRNEIKSSDFDVSFGLCNPFGICDLFEENISKE